MSLTTDRILNRGVKVVYYVVFTVLFIMGFYAMMYNGDLGWSGVPWSILFTIPAGYYALGCIIIRQTMGSKRFLQISLIQILYLCASLFLIAGGDTEYAPPFSAFAGHWLKPPAYLNMISMLSTFLLILTTLLFTITNFIRNRNQPYNLERTVFTGVSSVAIAFAFELLMVAAVAAGSS